MTGRNGLCFYMISSFFFSPRKIAQPKYAKGASEGAGSASVYGKLRSFREKLMIIILWKSDANCNWMEFMSKIVVTLVFGK